MHILLLIVYGALATYGIWKIPFLRKSGIRPAWLWLLFVLHVLTGWAHNLIAYRYFPEHGDIWNYFSLSFLYRHRLLSEFHLFVSDNSTWTYITHNGIVYVQMLLDLLSGDDMTVNTLLFAFPVFLGNVALFRVFRRRFAGDGMAAGAVVWLPSVVFWTACIYREGMLYMLLGFLFFHLDRLPARRSLYYAMALFLLIAYFRLAVAVVLGVALVVWWMGGRRWLGGPLARRTRLTVGLAGIVLLGLVFSVPWVRDPILGAVTNEQASFQMLEGHSRLPLPVLDGTLDSFWRAFPQAVLNGFFEPLPGSGGQTAYLGFSVELVFVWGVVLLAVVRVRRLSYSAFSAACVLFALGGMLLIGFVVPFAGTIVRYRSIYLPFLLAPALHSLRAHPVMQRLNRWLNNKLQFLI